MKYYSEKETKNLREAFEDEVLGWPLVGTRRMFGCPCYQAQGRLFAFLVTKGLVLTRLPKKDRDAMSREYQTSSFRAGKRTVQDWVRISIRNSRDLVRIMPFVRKSYEAGLEGTEI